MARLSYVRGYSGRSPVTHALRLSHLINLSAYFFDRRLHSSQSFDLRFETRSIVNAIGSS
jgi:hypothetical protein